MVTYESELIQRLNVEVVESLLTKSRSERCRCLSVAIQSDKMTAALKRILNGGHLSVWEHQARAIENLADGKNVVVSTGTASGKSLIFQIEALRRLLPNPLARAAHLLEIEA